MPKRKRTASATPLLDSLSAEQAAIVLAQLVRADPALAVRAEDVARDLLQAVDAEAVAASLAADLARIAIEDVWKTSGRIRDGGYLYPSERAWEMMDEVVAPYTAEMAACLRRGMVDASRLYCAGILLGIRQFERESGSALLEEEPDYCDDAFYTIREEWEEAVGDADQADLLARFLEEKGLL
ncbi:hypothetical protein FGU65_11130 [Methanoculleus sp. FWC-SCC1]|uniref:Uncharacterized protein n=1 Tax=Methanoculleus frigidifontis TaxID=2584085 RepID=A0ABT8MC29_9EURY|nr:hypothetical protein [Methanoculleus sp. FWC-SCC1]MDN7025441.1 hypothetical protein [Methanoculleus sp. FWC-SCC1]